jgi:hypothetical protein
LETQAKSRNEMQPAPRFKTPVAVGPKKKEEVPVLGTSSSL